MRDIDDMSDELTDAEIVDMANEAPDRIRANVQIADLAIQIRETETAIEEYQRSIARRRDILDRLHREMDAAVVAEKHARIEANAAHEDDES
jgi:lipopolysaccharide biosynthesis regulator YciM